MLINNQNNLVKPPLCDLYLGHSKRSLLVLDTGILLFDCQDLDIYVLEPK
jgi:hypothetical protein